MGKPRKNHLRPVAPAQASSKKITTVESIVEESVAPRQVGRREFLGTSGKAVAFLAAFQAISSRESALAQLRFDPFAYGVASGDPLPNRIIIWTRVTPQADATPGSGLGGTVRGIWEVARDAAFTQLAGYGRFTTTAATDHTVKIDVAGLAPLTDYYYRFNALGVNSPVGRMRTAPANGSTPSSVRFGLVSCSNYEAGYFTAYRHLAAREDLDFILHVGDYIYEYEAGAYGPPGFAGVARVHDPSTEIFSLSDYRRRHAIYKADVDLRALHARYPFITVWDDHETANNSWRDGAENHNNGEGAWSDRKAAGIRAYFEWMPIRPLAATGSFGEVRPIYRRFTFGNLADLFMIDLRQYRDEQVASPQNLPAINDANRTLLGSQQSTWLTQNISTSTAQWRLFGNSVQIAPIIIIPSFITDPQVQGALTAFFGVTDFTSSTPTPINTDSWDGYVAARNAILGVIGGLGNPANFKPNCLFLTGDIHSSYAVEIPGNSTNSFSLGSEFVCTSVTSDNVNEILGNIPEFVPNGIGGYVPANSSAQFVQLVQVFNSWVKDVDLEFHGFSVVDITPARAQMDNWVIRSTASPAFAADPRTDPNAVCVRRNSVQTVSGTQRITAAGSELGPR